MHYQFGRRQDVENRNPYQKYGFPEGCFVEEIVFVSEGRTPDIVFLEIWGAGAPSTNYPKAPAGSTSHDITNGAIYAASGTAGGLVSSWVEAT
jgi:hypothetical protein